MKKQKIRRNPSTLVAAMTPGRSGGVSPIGTGSKDGSGDCDSDSDGSADCDCDCDPVGSGDSDSDSVGSGVCNGDCDCDCDSVGPGVVDCVAGEDVAEGDADVAENEGESDGLFDGDWE